MLLIHFNMKSNCFIVVFNYDNPFTELPIKMICYLKVDNLFCVSTIPRLLKLINNSTTKNKKITTVKEVWSTRSYKLAWILTIFIFCLLLSFCFDWEDISNTRDSVSSPIRTPWISSKILRYASYFNFFSRCLDIPMKYCLSCLIYILLEH